MLRKALGITVLALLVVFCVQAVLAGSGGNKISKVFVWPEPCPNSGSLQQGQGHQPHGNVHIVYADGRHVQATNSGNCARVALAADGHTVGWIQGPCHREEVDGAWYVDGDLVLYRNGKVLRTLDGRFGDFRFRKGGAQVATAGPVLDGTCRLWDVSTGRVLAKHVMKWGQTTRSLPSWARGLEVIVGD